MNSLGTNLLFGIAVLGIMSGTLCSGGNGVRIKNLDVPMAVENGSKTAVILDCDYTLDDPTDTLGLVVKWYFNNQPDPVYQWILHEKPQDLGVLKGKLNLEYRASDKEHEMYRALQIIQPTTELSGIYSCLVSTFKDEASSSKKMVIYVPVKSLQLTQEKNENSLKMRCSAEGVYPEPNMTISSEDRRHLNVVTAETNTRQGLYDIQTEVMVDELDAPTKFDCTLRIPEANYTTVKSYNYYPTRPRTSATTRATPMDVRRPHPKYFPDAKLFSAPDSNAGHWVLPCSWLCTTVISLISSRL